MPYKKKKFSELEIETGMFAIDESKHDPDAKMTREEFMQNIPEGEFIGVTYKERVKWLEYNGYDVTRENLLDANLPTIKLPKELLIDNAPE